MTTTFDGIGGEGGSEEAFPENMETNKKKKIIQRTNLMENIADNPELEDLEGDSLLDTEDTIDEFSDADEFDAEDMENEDVVDVEAEGGVDLKIGDKVLSVSVEDAADTDEEEGDYDDAAEEGDDYEMEDLDDDMGVEDFMESFVKAVDHSPAQSPVESHEQARQHQPPKHKVKAQATPSESTPVEDEDDANQHANTERAKHRDIDVSGKNAAVKKDKAQSPVESLDDALQHAKGGGLTGVDKDPVDDGQVNRSKTDGKDTHEKIAPKNLSYETFMAKSDRIFNESFDSNYRNSGKNKKK